MTTAIDWVQIGRASIHATQRRILDELEKSVGDPRGCWSPIELSHRLGEPLGNVSYHVKVLREKGYLELVDTRQRRGAIEHFYRLVEK